MVGGDTRDGGGVWVITRVVMPLTHTNIYIRDGSGPNCLPRGPVTPNYILNNKSSLQDQNCEFIENTVIPDHCKIVV